MKNLITLIALITMASKAFGSDVCLTLKGSFAHNDKLLSDYEISVYENGTELHRVFCDKTKFKLSFPKNHLYSLEIRKAGFVTAVIIIDTSLPEESISNQFLFEFEYTMIPEQNNYNKEYIDFPAAIISYSESVDQFLLNLKYNTHIKEKLKMAKAN